MTQRFITLVIFCGLFFTYTRAQGIRTYSIELSCKTQTYNTNSSILEFSWPAQTPTTTAYNVYRKAKDRYDWGNPIRSLNTSDTSFRDTIAKGIAYEYMLEKYYGPDGFPTYGFIYAGHELAPVLNRGTMLLLVDSTHKSYISNELRTYRNDLIGDGWKTDIAYFSPSTTVSQLKSHILSRKSAISDLKSVVLIGDLAVAYSGNFSRNTAFWPPDGHVALPGYGPSHEGAWPCDLYYGSPTNSLWTDTLVNNTDGARPANHNVPNDGKFDITVLQELVELQVGRIDLSGMTVFKNDVSDTSNVEGSLLRRYFNKNHAFRHKQVNISERCLVDDNIGLIGGVPYNEQFAGNAYRNISTLFGKNKVAYNGGVDYLTTLNTQDYLFSFGFGYGSYTNCTGVGSSLSLASSSQQIKSVFSGFMGSYFGDWDTSNNFLRAPLAAKGNVLNTFWCGRPNWYFHHMGMGETIGYSTLRSQNNYDSFWSALFAQPLSLYPNMAYFPFEVHPALMGDPGVRLQPVYPVSALEVLQDSCGDAFRVSWTASVDTAAGTYYIFRANNIDSNFNLLGTTSNLSFIDNSPLSGDNVYMVRAAKLQTSGSGTYYNLSQGVFDTANTSDFYQPIALAGRDTQVCRNQYLQIGTVINEPNVSYQWMPGAYAGDTTTIFVDVPGERVLYATDLITGCVSTDTVLISTPTYPMDETVSVTSDFCSDTLVWSSSSNNGNGYLYSWTFNAGTPGDSVGFGLNNPGRVIYGTTGVFTAGLIVTDTASGCRSIMSQNAEIICVGLAVSWANLDCKTIGESLQIEFNLIDPSDYREISIELMDNEGEWTEIYSYIPETNGLQTFNLGTVPEYVSLRVSGMKQNGEWEELDVCSNTAEVAKVKAFPSPAENSFFVDLSNIQTHLPTEVKVFNSQGLVIYESTYYFEQGPLEINCSDWSHGLYTVRLYNSASQGSIQIVK